MFGRIASTRTCTMCGLYGPECMYPCTLGQLASAGRHPALEPQCANDLHMPCALHLLCVQALMPGYISPGYTQTSSASCDICWLA